MSLTNLHGAITLEAFTAMGTDRPGRRTVRCACGHPSCQGWAEVDTNTPWGLRPWEADPSTSGPLQPEAYEDPDPPTASAPDNPPATR